MRSFIAAARTRTAATLRSRAPLIAFAFLSYFILGTLNEHSWEPSRWSDRNETVLHFIMVYAVVVFVGVFAAPILEFCWRGFQERNQTWVDGVRSLGSGVLNVGMLLGVMVGVTLADFVSQEFGPDSYHQSWSSLANRLLDAGALASCMVSPSVECHVVNNVEWTPFRSSVAWRACKSGVAEAYGACRVPLAEGRLRSFEFCAQDARLPINESVCSPTERQDHRRSLGLMVGGR